MLIIQKVFLPLGLFLIALMSFPDLASAGDKFSSGDTAWIMTSTALVLFMTLPGLALFYGGLVTSKNVLSVLMQCFGIAVLASIVWLVIGYSIAFGSDGLFWGGTSKSFLAGITPSTLSGTIPENVFFPDIFCARGVLA